MARGGRWWLVLVGSCASAHATSGAVGPSNEVTVPSASASAAAPSASSSPSVAASVEPSSIASGSASVSSLDGAAPSASAAPPPLVCKAQTALPFLVRSSYWPVSSKIKEHQKALRFRTEHYGYVKGYGEPSWSTTSPKKETVSSSFFGLPVELHKRVAPALKCVEEALKTSCSATPYTPKALAGLRDRNTYRGGEITNHMYGIALDVDPDRNTCCACVKPWRDHPLCKKKSATVWDRMAMPKCWVDTFEKYGWYWLGHDRLQDTMHFEFLGDPDAVMGPP